MEKIRLKPFAIIPSHSTSNAYTLVLSEVNGKRKLPVVIGEHEAQAIALDLEKIIPPRPLTHELTKNILLSFGLVVLEIRIESFSEGIFYSKIVVSDGTATREIDARTSDAVALALKFDSPIYVVEEVLEQAGIVFEQTQEEDNNENDKEETSESKSDLAEFSMEKLRQMLKKAEEKEEYETASKIMEEINRRKEKK